MKETHHCFKEQVSPSPSLPSSFLCLSPPSPAFLSSLPQILRHISSANRAGEAYTKLVERRETLSQKKVFLFFLFLHILEFLFLTFFSFLSFFVVGRSREESNGHPKQTKANQSIAGNRKNSQNGSNNTYFY